MFNPRPLIQQVPIGDGGYCMVVDDVLLEPQKLRQTALAQRDAFIFNPGNYYPGIEQPLPPEFDQRLGEFFDQHLLRAFDASDAIGLATRMSLVTLRPEELSPQQRICHRDARSCEPGQGACASVLYLFDDARLGGTSFYRPLRHPDEIDHLLYQARFLDSAGFSKVIGAQPAYFNQGYPYFEKICTVAAKWNRAIFYDATTFHSGQIDAPELLTPDPAHGRLTVNAFIRYRKHSG